MKKGSMAGTAPWLRSTLKWPAGRKPRARRSMCRSTATADVERVATSLILNSALDDRRPHGQTTAQFLAEVAAMPTYLMLLRYTQTGIQNIKESPSRLDAAR